MAPYDYLPEDDDYYDDEEFYDENEFDIYPPDDPDYCEQCNDYHGYLEEGDEDEV